PPWRRWRSGSRPRRRAPRRGATPAPARQIVEPWSFPLPRAASLCDPAMAARKLSLSAIQAVSKRLPGLEEGTSCGTPAWRHRGRLLARLHQDGEAIVLNVGVEARDHLMQADPETFSITDHYRGGTMMLARLDRLSARDLEKILARAM